MASGHRGFLLRCRIGCIHRRGMSAVPPFLQPTAETNREQGEHGGGGTRAGLQQLNGIGGTAARRQVRNEAPPHPTPARLLTAPGQTTAGPGKLLPIKQAAAGADDPEAVLAARAGVNAAGLQQLLDFRTTHSAGGGSGRSGTSDHKKPPPRGWSWNTLKSAGAQ